MISKVVVNENGTNRYIDIVNPSTISGMSLKKRSFASFQFQDNVVNTPLTQNIWTQFANPTGGLVKIFDNGPDFLVNTGELAITYTGTATKIFTLSAVTNIFRGGVGNVTNTLELQWKLNTNFVGFSRQSQSNTESNIYTGNGLIVLSTGDVISPWVQNIENSDDVRLDNASFILSEEISTYYS